jgi:hypothetical protein
MKRQDLREFPATRTSLSVGRAAGIRSPMDQGDLWIDRGEKRSHLGPKREDCRGRDCPQAIPGGPKGNFSNSAVLGPQNAFFGASGLTSPKCELFLLEFASPSEKRPR